MKHLLLFILLISTPLFAQQRTLTGVVHAEDGTALPGVNVAVKNTRQGTITDTDGRFTLPLVKGETLLFSFIGFTAKELPITTSNEYNVTLLASTHTLGEVQVVGSRNANRTKTDSPVPVDMIDLKPLQESAPQVSITQLLQYVSPSFHSVNGTNAGDQVTASNQSAATRALGIPTLTPEKSKGYAVGFTSQPFRSFQLTVDAYLVDVDNRVGNTGNFSATDVNLPAEVRALFVQTGTTQA